MNAFLSVLIAGLTPILVLGILVSGIALGLVAWQPPVVWSNQFGVSEWNSQNGLTSMSSDPNGLYLGGFVGYPRDLSGPTPSASYVFVSKYDLNGHETWTQQIGNPRFVKVSGEIT